ncbi:Dynein light chain DLC [Fasciola hepatica]|uniref:Dynein light chain n=1 Tax=Fasciola hepatica TaxID=6192 RepID=A0A4E0RB23_FASHE|nr:Dynein light chain DLC [Fasciola hepatica]
MVRKISVRSSEMAEDKKQDAIAVTMEALELYDIEKNVAAHVKKVFDKKYGPTWHCVVGYQFGSYVTHDENNFIYLDLGVVGLLLFKCG